MAVPPFTLWKNFMGYQGTPETRDQEEWMKKTLLNKARSSGSLTGSLDYSDYGSTTANHPSGDWTGGYLGPEFAYGTTLGKADYSIPQQGGQVDWTGGTAYDFPKGWLGGGVGDMVANTINTGGLADMTGGQPQHYTPNTNISLQDIMNIFSGGKMVHKGEPTINQPTTQPTTTNQLTPAQIQQINAMDTQLTQSQVPSSTPPVQTPVQTGPTQGQIAAEARAKAQAQAQAQAQQRAQEQARARAQAEAQAKAQAEARAQAREQARLSDLAAAQARAQQQAQQRAQQQAHAQAQQRAQAERAAQEQAQAQQRAQQQAHAQAQQRAQAERAAQAQAQAQAQAAASRAQAQAEAARNTREQARQPVYNPPPPPAPPRGPVGGPPPRTRTTSPSPVFKSYGPPNMQRY